MIESDTGAWRVAEQQFCGDTTMNEKLCLVLRYAILAPSSHNTQPWRFVIGDERILVCADRARALRVSDPFDRELTISCGAALFNLRVALSRFDLPYVITAFPAQADPDVLAEVRITTRGFIEHEIGALLPAITQRTTTRERFADRPLPVSLHLAIEDAAQIEGLHAVVIDALDERVVIGELIAEADHRQFANAAFRRELAHWLRPPSTDEGMPAYSHLAQVLLEVATPVAASIVRTFDLGNGAAASHRDLVAGSPALVLLTSDADRPAEWLATGQALERILLTLAQSGVTASYLNQPIEVESLRKRLAQLCGVAGTPQLLLRVGYGPPVRHSGRRSLDAVVS
jgi:Nitroreductase family